MFCNIYQGSGGQCPFSDTNVPLQVHRKPVEMMTNNKTKRIKESVCVAGIPVLRRHRVQVTRQLRKRTLSLASLSASLTIEAALALTLFMFTVILLSVPMEILDTQRKVQTVLETTGRELEWLVYQRSHKVHPAEKEEKNVAGKTAGSDETEFDIWSKVPTDMILRMYLKEKIQTEVGKRVSDVRCDASRISDNGEWIDLRAVYQVRLPFSIFALNHIRLSSRSCKRGWIGVEGGYFSKDADSEKEDEWVYVGRDSTRYHISESCHYISNQITAVAYEDVGSLKNADGGHYKACKRCGRHIAQGGTVYILPSGDAYHGSEDCSSLAYYVRKVRLSDVEYLGKCSYCGGG